MTFEIKNKYRKARVGILHTKHGKIDTPNLATVATHGTIRVLNQADHKKANPDLIIANTFHLWVRKKVSEIKKAGGIHKWNKIKKPTMTDSGGFQVFSLGWGSVHGIGKVAKKDTVSQERIHDKKEKNPVIINDDGVIFTYDNKKMELTPEKSMKIQWDIRADIIFAFDECTSPLHSHTYTKKSLETTHRWAERSLKAHNKHDKKDEQLLFGIVQGGIFEDLRKKSSKFIGSLPFDGFGIGGSFGEKEMGTVLGWSLSSLPEDKPRHFLGIGRVKDIFTGVEKGVDLFDCVIPTREARHGVLYTKEGKVNIRRGTYSNDKKIIEKGCLCSTCAQKITRKTLRELFKSQNDKDRQKFYRLATIHNIQFYKTLFHKIRKTISAKKSLSTLKKEYKVYLS